MKRLGLLGIILMLVALTAFGAGGVAGQEDENPLLAMLGMFEAEGFPMIRKARNVEVVLATIPVAGVFNRIVAGPQALGANLARPGGSDVVGFELLVDMDRSIEYGTPPQVGWVLSGEFDADAIGTALSGRGFEQRDVSGVTVWHRFDDEMIDLNAVEPLDPFGGQLGASARIAVMDGYLANARYWQMIEDIIAAAQGSMPSLADDPAYAALAEIITAGDGLLLQALFFNGIDLAMAVPPDQESQDEGEQAETPAEDYGQLPPFGQTVLADRQEGQDQVHLLGLMYGDSAMAQQAADEVAARIETFVPVGLGTNLIDEFGATVTPRVVELESGQAIAVVEVRYPLPQEREDPETGMYITGSPIFRYWVRSIMQRGFRPLSAING
jgi:hypothetical protein